MSIPARPQLIVARATGGISVVDAVSGVQLAGIMAHRGGIHTLQLFSIMDLGLEPDSTRTEFPDNRPFANAAAEIVLKGPGASTDAIAAGVGADFRAQEYILSSGEDCCVRVSQTGSGSGQGEDNTLKIRVSSAKSGHLDCCCCRRSICLLVTKRPISGVDTRQYV